MSMKIRSSLYKQYSSVIVTTAKHVSCASAVVPVLRVTRRAGFYGSGVGYLTDLVGEEAGGKVRANMHLSARSVPLESLTLTFWL